MGLVMALGGGSMAEQIPIVIGNGAGQVEQTAAARVLGVTPGDKGMLCHLNFTWLPYFTQKQQQFGTAAYRMNFIPTHHDSLARKPGKRTYYYDRERQPWCGRGEQETGVVAFEDESLTPTTTHEEVCATWISGSGSFTVQLMDAVGDTANLSAGNYDVQLFFPGHLVTAAGQRVVRVRVGGTDLGEIDLYSGSAVTVKTVSDISISAGKLRITVEKATGDPAISGVVLATDMSVGVRGSQPSKESSYPIEHSPLNSLGFGVDGGDNAPDMPAEDLRAPSGADHRQAVAFDDAAHEPTESALAIYMPPEELSEPAATPDNQRQAYEQEPTAASGGAHATDPRSVVSEVEGGAELLSGTLSNERAEPKATALIGVTASSFNGANVPHRTVDGDFTTHWAPAGSDAEWIEYDLGAVRPLAGVVLSWYGQRGCDAQVVASVSEDGARYRVAATHALRGRGFHTTRITFNQPAGRYLRLQLLPEGDRVVGLIEVSVPEERSPVLMSSADGD